MRVLVIGANGAIGKQVVEKLLGTSHEPVAMVRKNRANCLFRKLRC